MREVPRRPNAEELQQYQTDAAALLRTAIRAAIRDQDSVDFHVYANAASAIGDYAIARSRWLKFYQEDYL